MSQNVLLINVAAIKARTGVHLNNDEKLIVPEIKAAQDVEIVSALGTRLFERLQAGIREDNLTEKERTLLDDYITDALVYFTLSALPVATSFQFFTKGMLRNSNENSDMPSMSDLVELSKWYSNRGKYYRQRLIRYIHVNREHFPLYECNSDNDVNPSKTSYRLGMYLGD